MDIRLLISVTVFSLSLGACGYKKQQVSNTSRAAIYDAWDARYVYEMQTRRMIPLHQGREVGRTWGRDEKGKINYASYARSDDKVVEDLYAIHTNRLDRIRDKKWESAKSERINFVKNQLDVLEEEENAPLIEVPIEDKEEEFYPQLSCLRESILIAGIICPLKLLRRMPSWVSVCSSTLNYVRMSRVTIFLQAFAVIASLAGIILTFSAVSEHDQDFDSIALQKLKIKEAEKNLAELRDKYASDQLRQKSRNLDLSEEIAELKKASDEIDVKLARTKEEIEEIENSLSYTIADKDATKQKQSDSATAVKGVQSKIENLRGELPRIRQEVEAKRFEIDDFENRISELAQKLTVYSEITSVVREHYLSTISSLRTYARARPWLEPGEGLTLELKSVDLISGYIALSEGGNAGVREDMIFSVKFENREISKIRVKKVFRNYSLAELIPLIGNP